MSYFTGKTVPCDHDLGMTPESDCSGTDAAAEVLTTIVAHINANASPNASPNASKLSITRALFIKLVAKLALCEVFCTPAPSEC